MKMHKIAEWAYLVLALAALIFSAPDDVFWATLILSTIHGCTASILKAKNPPTQGNP